MKKVIHLISTHAFSGAENVICQIINAFEDEKNVEMIYVSEIKENKEMLEDRNVNYYALKEFNYKNVKKAVQELSPDIIHAHDPRATVIAAMFSKQAKIISHIHGNHEYMRKKNLKTLVLRFFSNRVSQFIWVAKSALNNYIFYENVKSKSIILYNAINVEEVNEKIALDKNDYNFDIAYLGRLSEEKNPERLISIIERVQRQKKDVKVAIIGDGNLHDSVVSKINEFALNENIKLFGFQKNPYKILSSSKILVMTSRHEGTPMCALEAIGLGKPIVSTPTDGLCELVDDGINGYLSDDDDVLANNIVEVVTDTEKYKAMQKATMEKNKVVNNIANYKNEISNLYF